MKKIPAKLISLGLILAMSASFAACDRNKPMDQTTTEATSISTTTEVPTAPVSGTTQTQTESSTSTTMPVPKTTVNPVIGNNKEKIAAYYNQVIASANSKGKVTGSNDMKIKDCVLNGNPSPVLEKAARALMGMFFKSEKLTKLPPNSKAFASVKASDLSKASCTQEGNTLIIKMTGVTEEKPSLTSSAHARMFNLIDLETNIKNNVTFHGNPAQDLVLTYKNSTITATVDATTGRLRSLKTEMNVYMSMKNVKALFVTVNEKGAQVTLTTLESYTISY